CICQWDEWRPEQCRSRGALRCDGIVIARSHKASKDSRRSTGYSDEAIQRTKGAPQSLDCFATARPEGRASLDAIWLSMTIAVRSKCNWSRQARRAARLRRI